MPRRPRELIEGGIYHVYNRAASGEDIFSDPETAIEFLDLVSEVKQRGGLTVFAWTLMSNHDHLVIRTSAVPLSRSMHSIQSSFGHRFNRRFRRTGGVWQSRYQARLVDEGGYLAEVCSLLDTDMERPAGRTKDRETAELRRLVAALGVERWRQRCKDLAGVLGKTPTS